MGAARMIADLKPYAAYKDSGSEGEWLARIPSHWDRPCPEVHGFRTTQLAFDHRAMNNYCALLSVYP
jgi:hypothetical protein